jgi:hypothetical protein
VSAERLWREWARLRDNYYAGDYPPKMKRLIEYALDMAFLSLKETDRYCYSDLPHYVKKCERCLRDAEHYIALAKRYFSVKSPDELWCREILRVVKAGEENG